VPTIGKKGQNSTLHAIANRVPPPLRLGKGRARVREKTISKCSSHRIRGKRKRGSLLRPLRGGRGGGGGGKGGVSMPPGPGGKIV